MKTLIVIFAAFLLASMPASAQQISKGGGKISKNNAAVTTAEQHKNPVTTSHNGRWASREEQRSHAEKMSKGHAFSGKGKGHDKEKGNASAAEKGKKKDKGKAGKKTEKDRVVNRAPSGKG